MNRQIKFLSLDEWQAVVETRDESTVFHHRRWIELITEHYGWTTFIPAYERGGNIEAAIPFVETRGALGARKLISLPFTDCVPALRWESQLLIDLSTALHRCSEFQRHRAIVTRWDKPMIDSDKESDWYRHVLDVSRAPAQIERGFSQPLIRNLKKTKSGNLEYRCRSDAQAMQIFYRLHVLTRKKLGVPVQPRKFFSQLQDKIISNGLGHIGVVECGGSTIAAAVFLTYKKTTIYKYGASDPHFLRKRPNEFLFLHAINQAHHAGHRHFDFGITPKDQEGLRRFKRKWGPIEQEVHHVYLAGEPRLSSGRSRLISLMAPVIRNSPSLVCRAVGVALYRFSQ